MNNESKFETRVKLCRARIKRTNMKSKFIWRLYAITVRARGESGGVPPSFTTRSARTYRSARRVHRARRSRSAAPSSIWLTVNPATRSSRPGKATCSYATPWNTRSTRRWPPAGATIVCRTRIRSGVRRHSHSLRVLVLEDRGLPRAHGSFRPVGMYAPILRRCLVVSSPPLIRPPQNFNRRPDLPRRGEHRNAPDDARDGIDIPTFLRS